MVLGAVLRVAKQHPFKFGMGYSLFKTAGCDILVQKVVEKREEIDVKRTTTFAAFGLFYLGGVQYMIYVPLFMLVARLPLQRRLRSLLAGSPSFIAAP